MTKHVLAIVAALLLSACANDTELQHDGSGTDQMLKSPCAGAAGSPCAPVPYEAPHYRWIVG